MATCVCQGCELAEEGMSLWVHACGQMGAGASVQLLGLEEAGAQMYM